MNKKSLIFIEDGSFTYDNRVIQETNALINAGWDITVISPKCSIDPYYKKFNNKLRSYYYPKPTIESIFGHIIEFFFTLFFGSGLSFWIFIRHGFSVFHACNPMDILWLIALPYKIMGKKFIFDQHDLVPELIVSRSHISINNLFCKIFIFFEKCSYKLADAVIVTNNSFKKIALNRGRKRPQDVFIVRNGPELNKFRKATRMMNIRNKNEILIGYLGNMNPQDGVEYLLMAAEIIIKKRKISNIKFILIGGGSSQLRLIELSKKMGLENYVIFVGKLFGDELMSILNTCDICVQPDPFNPLNDKSTMNKVLEYMALEKPIVAFNLNETRISCGNAALYAKPNSMHDFAEKILYLVNHPKLGIRMGQIGRERIERKFSWKYSIPHLINAYEHALKSS